MKPIKVYKDTVDMEDLLRLSKKYLIKATDGKSMVVIQSGKIILAEGDPPKEKREVVIAIYEAQKKMSLKNAEYFVCKIDSMISRNIKADLEKIVRNYEHIVIETFSRRAKKVILVYRNRNLVYFDGDYNKLLTENKAIFDVYEVLREELRVTRRDVLERFRLKDPSEEEIQNIIQHAFGDGIGRYYSP